MNARSRWPANGWRDSAQGAFIQDTMTMLRPAVFSLALSCVALPLAATACSRSNTAAADVALLPVGALAPDVSAVDQHGNAHRLSETRGQATVVYFYPRDATPGCTKEACAFRDIWKSFEEAGVHVFGVSTDDQKSKAAFAKEYKLPFPILADPDKQWVEAFRVPTKLGMASRVTFLLDREGRVAKVYPDVDPGVHAQQVLGDARALGLTK